MRKIKTKAELKGLAQVPHPSFTQVSCCPSPCMRVVLFAWVNCIKELKGKLKTKLLIKNPIGDAHVYSNFRLLQRYQILS